MRIRDANMPVSFLVRCEVKCLRMYFDVYKNWKPYWRRNFAHE
jgi:hypothetical protein